MAKRSLYYLVACAALLAVPSNASAENVIRLAPVTPWHVDWTKTSCTLARGFGEKGDPQVLQFEQFSQGQSFQLVIAAKSLRGLQQSDRPTIV
jgi:hypothetical protein